MREGLPILGDHLPNPQLGDALERFAADVIPVETRAAE
jgi:hypothetical protein